MGHKSFRYEHFAHAQSHTFGSSTLRKEGIDMLVPSG